MQTIFCLIVHEHIDSTQVKDWLYLLTGLHKGVDFAGSQNGVRGEKIAAQPLVFLGKVAVSSSKSPD